MSLSLRGYLSHSITVAITNIDTIIPCQDYCNTLLLGLTTSFLIFLQSFLYSSINTNFFFFLDALGLHCCKQSFSSCREWGATLCCGVRSSRSCGFSCPRALAPGTRLQQLQHTGSAAVLPGPQSTGSEAVAHRLSCSKACGIFPDQGLNLCPLLQQVGSYPLCH